jgi:hypothetical protein
MKKRKEKALKFVGGAQYYARGSTFVLARGFAGALRI